MTRAFSEAQLRLAALKRAKIVVGDRGMEKFACDECIKRGIDSPRVTLDKVSSVLSMSVVVQPVAPAMLQAAPVKPFMHIHEQLWLSTTLWPPFSQGSLCWHEARVDIRCDAGFGL